jgi:hypothetical protein
MLAENFGLTANVLRVNVENNNVKDIRLSDYKTEITSLGIIYR